MKRTVLFVVVAMVSGPLAAQERKPVPKNSVRVFLPGCSKGFVFTVGRPAADQPEGSGIPEGTHLRMNGPKELMAEIKGQEGSRIEITGLVKKGQVIRDGVGIGRGGRVTAGQAPSGGLRPDPGVAQIMIDVEGWRRILGDCPSR